MMRLEVSVGALRPALFSTRGEADASSGSARRLCQFCWFETAASSVQSLDPFTVAERGQLGGWRETAGRGGLVGAGGAARIAPKDRHVAAEKTMRPWLRALLMAAVAAAPYDVYETWGVRKHVPVGFGTEISVVADGRTATLIFDDTAKDLLEEARTLVKGLGVRSAERELLPVGPDVGMPSEGRRSPSDGAKMSRKGARTAEIGSSSASAEREIAPVGP